SPCPTSTVSSSAAPPGPSTASGRCSTRRCANDSVAASADSFRSSRPRRRPRANGRVPCGPGVRERETMADVVALGIHILDILGRPVSRIPPKQDVDLIEEIRLTVAGTAAGTSVDLAKLGVDVLAMGAIGEDAAGNFIVDTMGRYGI